LAASVDGASVPYLLHQRPGKFLGNGWWDGSNLWRSLIRSPFNLVPPDLGFTLVMIVMNLAGIWRSQYGQERTGDFTNYRATMIHAKATGFGPDEPAVLKA
jgi:hypothetical protein